MRSKYDQNAIKKRSNLFPRDKADVLGADEPDHHEILPGSSMVRTRGMVVENNSRDYPAALCLLEFRIFCSARLRLLTHEPDRRN